MSLSEDATITSKGQVTVPKKIRDRLNLEAGTEVEFVLTDDGRIELRPKKPPMDRLREIQSELSSKEIDLEQLRQESKTAWSSLDSEEIQ